MASLYEQLRLQEDSRPRAVQIMLAAFGLGLVAAFFYSSFRLNETKNIAAGIIMLLFPAYLYVSAAYAFFRKGTEASELDRLWAKWLLRSALAAAVVALALICYVVVDFFRSRDSDTILFLVTSPFLAFFVLFEGMMLRRYFGPLAPAPLTNAPELKVLSLLAWPARRLIDFLRPLRCLSLGSLLVLASLLLVTSANLGCQERYYRGYQILNGHVGWLTAEHSDRFTASIINPVARVTYVAALICAIAALAAVARSRSAKGRIRLPSWYTPAVAIATIFTFSDFAMFFSHGGQKRPVLRVVLCCCYWVLPLVAYSLYGRSRDLRLHRKWPLVRTSLAVLYLPALTIAWCMIPAVVVFRVFGYLAYFIGIQLLWFGAIQASVAEPVPEMRPSSSSAAAGGS